MPLRDSTRLTHQASPSVSWPRAPAHSLSTTGKERSPRRRPPLRAALPTIRVSVKPRVSTTQELSPTPSLSTGDQLPTWRSRLLFLASSEETGSQLMLAICLHSPQSRSCCYSSAVLQSSPTTLS